MPREKATYDIELSLDLAGPEVYAASLKLPHRSVRGDYPIRLPDANVPSPFTGPLAKVMQAAFGPLLGWTADPALARLLTAIATGGTPSPSALRDFERALGRRLFEEVFQGDVRRTYESGYSEARRSDLALQVRLQLHPTLRGIPFELMYHPGQGLFLGGNTYTSLVRGTLGEPVGRPPADCPLRILAVVASPKGTATLNVGEEKKRLKQALERMAAVGIWQLDVLEGADTLQRLQNHPAKERFDVLHFVGHGYSDAGGAGLVLEDASGQLHRADASDLAAGLVGFRRLRLVVLNSCFGGHYSGESSLGSVAEQLIRTEIPAIIAMQRQISDFSAIQFCKHLYQGVANCRPIGEAVNSARCALIQAGKTETWLDWFNPQVFLRSDDGRLFLGATGDSPAELRIAKALEAGDIETALEVYDLIGDWQVADLPERLDHLASRVFDVQNWDLLVRVVTICDDRGLRPALLERWRKIAAARKKWESDTLPNLTKAIRGTDPIAAARAGQRCFRLSEGLSLDQAEVTLELYGDDRELRERCRLKDMDRLAALRKGYAGPLLSEPAILLLDALETLIRDAGVALRIPEPPQEIDPDLRRTLFQLRPGDRDSLARARARLGSDGGSAWSLEDWLHQLHPLLAPELPLVRWTLGMKERAVAGWEEQARSDPDRTRRWAALAHLAFVEAADRKNSVGSDERRLAPWTVLLLPSVWREGGFWSQRLGPGVDRERVRAALASWVTLRNESASHENDSPRSEVYRELAWVDEEVLPAELKREANPWVAWFEREREAAELVARLSSEVIGKAALVVGGPALVGRLGTEDALAALHRAAEANADAVPLLRELRRRFSSLREFGPDGRGFTGAGLACPSCSESPGAGGLEALPASVRPRVCRADCPEFRARNPLHARLDPTGSLFRRDVLHSMRGEYLDLAVEAVRSVLPLGSSFDEALDVLRATTGSGPRDAEDLWKLQEAVLERCRGIVAGAPSTVLDHTAHLMGRILGLIDSMPLREAFVDLLVLESKRKLDEKDCLPSMARLHQALSWCPHRDDIRVELAEFYAILARTTLDSRQFTESRRNLEQFDEIVGKMAVENDRIVQYKKDADAVRKRLDQPSEAVSEEDKLIRELLEKYGNS